MQAARPSTPLPGIPHWLHLLLGGLFIYSGVSKSLQFSLFAQNVESYLLLPSWAILPAASLIPVSEMLAGCFLVLNVRVRIALACTLLMLVLFTLALLSAWMRGLEISCGCFGVSTVQGEYLLWLVRNGILLIASGFLLKTERRFPQRAPDKLLHQRKPEPS